MHFCFVGVKRFGDGNFEREVVFGNIILMRGWGLVWGGCVLRILYSHVYYWGFWAGVDDEIWVGYMFKEGKYRGDLPSVVALVVKSGGGMIILSPLYFKFHLSNLLHQLHNQFIMIRYGGLSHHNISKTDLFIVVPHYCFFLIWTLVGKGICDPFRSSEVWIIIQLNRHKPVRKYL